MLDSLVRSSAERRGLRHWCQDNPEDRRIPQDGQDAGAGGSKRTDAVLVPPLPIRGASNVAGRGVRRARGFVACVVIDTAVIVLCSSLVFFVPRLVFNCVGPLIPAGALCELLVARASPVLRLSLPRAPSSL